MYWRKIAPVVSSNLRRSWPSTRYSWKSSLFSSLVAWLLAAPSTTAPGFASAAPIPAPNISYCRLDPDTPYDCCAPPSHSAPKQFQFDPSPTLRIRRPAHKVSDEDAQKLAHAYQLMRDLPHDDPRSFGHQANIHCAYCNEFYVQGNSTAPFQVHASWLFFSFHRWYLYFHERILAKLLGDDTLALPFWNYDHPDGSTMPSMYLNYFGLQDTYREPSHLPPTVAAIDTISLGHSSRSREDQLNVNRGAFHWVMVAGATTQYKFFGHPYRFGDKQMPGYGTVETMPHIGIHAWVGDLNEKFLDMGLFSTAARDPIFYAHHSSLDRLWEVWKSLSENNTDIDDPDYLDSEFVFYDENAELVKVTVRDSLNATKLGYTFEEVENQWLNATPVAQSFGVAQLGEDAVICQMSEALIEPCSVSVARDKHVLSTKGGEAETLVIQDIYLSSTTKPVQFNVFVNLPTADASTLINCTEFAGLFSTLVATNSISTSLRLGIGIIVRELNLTLEDALVVTIVPTSESAAAVSISSVTIQYEDVAESSTYAL